MMARNGDVVLGWDEQGSGDALLLIHGLGYARWGWEPLLPLLDGHFRVISFDNRGIGDSSVPPGPYDAAQMAGDALAVLDDAGVERAHVVGTSLGGMIAQEVALAAPGRVDRLVLIATNPGTPHAYPMPEATVRLLTEAPAWDPAVALRRFVENALGPAPDADIVERILEHRTSRPQSPEGWAAQAAAGTTFHGGDRAREITAPTLLISGEEDRVVDPRNTTLLGEMIPDSTTSLIADAGHLVFWEHPRTVADQMIDFLA